MVVFLLQGYLTSGREVGSGYADPMSLYSGSPMRKIRLIVLLLRLRLWNLQALARTLWMSGAYAAFENMVAMVYVFGAHVPLFLYGCGPAI